MTSEPLALAASTLIGESFVGNGQNAAHLRATSVRITGIRIARLEHPLDPPFLDTDADDVRPRTERS